MRKYVKKDRHFYKENNSKFKCSLYTWIPDPAAQINADPDSKLWFKNSVADPGSGAFLTPGSGMGKKSGSGSGIRDEKPGSYFRELRNHFFVVVKIPKFLDANPGSGIRE